MLELEGEATEGVTRAERKGARLGRVEGEGKEKEEGRGVGRGSDV